VAYSNVINFWFEEITPAQWWKKDDEFDRLIADRFSDLHAQAIQCELSNWREAAEGRLAEIIVLDQFSRNMFRGDAASFASDSLALVLAQEAIAVGADQQLNDLQRPFMYLPFMHSESLAVHDVALDLYTRNASEDSLKFEIRHRDIIVQFGRYPHRNDVLGRASTTEEIAFLSQPGSSF